MISLRYDAIVEISWLFPLSDDALMLVLPDSLQLITFSNSIDHSDIFNGVTACSIPKEGVYSVMITYNGFCGDELHLEC